MMEALFIGGLAMSGIVLSALLLFHAFRTASREDPDPPALSPLAPEKLEPPYIALEWLGRPPDPEIFAIMAEHYPREYRRYRSGVLDHSARRRVWEACLAIHDARAEIEELTAPRA